MTSFGWKRKAGAGVIRKASEAFEEEAKDEELDNEVTRGEVDWLTLAPKKRLIGLEDAKAKSRRLCDEGATLAEAERYWEAIKKWDEALLMTPGDSRMLEMKAQALMSVGEAFPAVHTAQQAVDADPTWWVARQTLGRAELNLGELRLAIRSFSKAVMINPADRELWEEDLMWAWSVKERSKISGCSGVGKASRSLLVSQTIGAVEMDRTEPGSEEEMTVTQNNSIVPRTNSAEEGEQHSDDSESTQADVRQTLLNIPPNYVHLRG